MKYRLSLMACGLFLCGALFASCSSSSVTISKPAWVDQGSGFYAGEWGKAFYGVGAATGIQNVQLRRTVAETNARADLARSFKSRISDLVKVYMRNVSGGQPNASNEEQVNQQVTQAFTDMTLAGVPVVGHYYDQSEKTMYALVVMDVNSMKDQITQMKQLSKEVQDAILNNADKAFQELDTLKAQNK